MFPFYHETIEASPEQASPDDLLELRIEQLDTFLTSFSVILDNQAILIKSIMEKLDTIIANIDNEPFEVNQSRLYQTYEDIQNMTNLTLTREKDLINLTDLQSTVLHFDEQIMEKIIAVKTNCLVLERRTEECIGKWETLESFIKRH